MRGASGCGGETPSYLHLRQGRFETHGFRDVSPAVAGCMTTETPSEGVGSLLPVEGSHVVLVDRAAGATILDNRGASTCG